MTCFDFFFCGAETRFDIWRDEVERFFWCRRRWSRGDRVDPEVDQIFDLHELSIDKCPTLVVYSYCSLSTSIRGTWCAWGQLLHLAHTGGKWFRCHYCRTEVATYTLPYAVAAYSPLLKRSFSNLSTQIYIRSEIDRLLLCKMNN